MYDIFNKRVFIMIKQIHIFITNHLNYEMEAKIDFSSKKCLLNQQSYSISDSFLEQLLSILSSFSNSVSSRNVIDAEECRITIISDKVEKFSWKGKVPLKYLQLKELLGDLYDSKLS